MKYVYNKFYVGGGAHGKMWDLYKSCRIFLLKEPLNVSWERDKMDKIIFYFNIVYSTFQYLNNFELASSYIYNIPLLCSYLPCRLHNIMYPKMQCACLELPFSMWRMKWKSFKPNLPIPSLLLYFFNIILV